MKLKKENYHTLIKIFIVFCFFSIILSDWANFKSGLKGEKPIVTEIIP
jgi:hypothetical protein